ncbi:MAG: DUF2236 domain-containing protein [Betaproteobacteria bacterium]|nr:DUF2236 domain-containing protein [Betaproteobacteria bacterium]
MTRPSTNRLSWRQRLFFYVRSRVGLHGPLIDICVDPELAYTPLDSPMRVVHADLPAMLVGGVASLLTQMLHPVAMRALSEHSRYQDDPLGRLYGTGRFLALTTYASKEDALQAINTVRRIHQGIDSRPEDPSPYRGDDPALLAWIHAAEVAMFLGSYQVFGPAPLTPHDADRYVADMGVTGAALGVIDPPRTVAALRDVLALYAPILALTPQAQEARDFLLAGTPYTGRLRHWGFDRIVESAITLLEPAHRRTLELPAARVTWRHRFALRALRFAGRHDV